MLLCALLSLGAVALAKGSAKTISTAEIRPGMKGYGLTVFRGTKPERFEVEVIDVLHNFRPDQDLILVRTRHPVLQRAKLVAGMSGSPVYLDGRLAGAYAYGWPFSTEAVAGVTPIRSIFAELHRPLDPQVWDLLGTLPKRPKVSRVQQRRPPRALGGLRAYTGNERVVAHRALRAHASHFGGNLSYSSVATPMREMIPAATTVMVGGLGDRALSVLGQELERLGLVALQAGGASRARAQLPQRFEDGSAIGVQLIAGDISATAIGTVTHVAGRRLVAFGHPMMNAGQSALPTATAKVVHVLSSERRSFKLAETLTPLGTLVHDRQATIVIDTELQPSTVPVRIRVHGAKGAPRTQWDVRVASQRALTPMLVFSAILNAIGATAAERADVIFDVDSRVTLERHGVVETRDQGYAPLGMANPLSLSRLRLFSVLEAAYGNPFELARPTSIEVDVNLRFARDVVEILDAMVASREVDPGRDVNLYVTLREFDRAPRVQRVPVHIPATAAGETVELVVEAGDEVRLEHPKPDNLDDILQIVREGYPATELVVSTRLAARGLRLRGHVVRDLPGSALAALQFGNRSDKPVVFQTHDRKRVELGRVIAGTARIKLEVREEPLR